jgi:hypothetical protein
MLLGSGFDWLIRRCDTELLGSIKRWKFLDKFSGIKCSDINPIHGVSGTCRADL